MYEFFPSTAVVDKGRYPDIKRVIGAAQRNRLKFIKENIICQGKDIELGNHFLQLIEKKGYSMLHLISEQDYQEDMLRVRKEMAGGPIKRKMAG